MKNLYWLFVILLGMGATALSAQPFAPGAHHPGEYRAPRDLAFNPNLRPFYHGVASGDPTTSGVMIWTRVTPDQAGPVEVSYQVATDLGFENIVASGSVSTDESRDYTVKVDVGGLAPGVTYFYYFSAMGMNSLVGRAKTVPAGDVSHLRFGVVSCSNYEGGYFNAYGTLAQRNDLDGVLHLGDYIYEYGAGVYGANLPDRVNNPSTEILSLTDYRTRYSLYRLDPNLIRAHQQHTFITVWDDHESANDSYVDGAENHQPNEGDWETRKGIAKQVYFEWLPIRDNNNQEIYRKFQYGNLCDVLMLDTRLEGRQEPPPSFDTPDNPPRQMISPTQEAWLVDNLTQSTARWKVLGNQVLFSTFNVGFAAGAFDGTPDLTNIDSIRAAENIFIDNWESYPTQRNALIDTLRHLDINDVVIVTGDSHCSWAFDVTAEAVQYPVPAFLNLPQPNPYNPATGEGYNPATGEGSWAVEIGTPSISSPNFDEAIGAATTAQFEFLMNNPIPGFGLEYNPHLKYVDLDRHGYFILDLKPDTAQADFFYIPSQFVDSLAENFGTGAYTLTGANRLQVRTQPATGKAIQDPTTPTSPFGTVATREASSPLALFALYPNPAGEAVYLQFGLNESLPLSMAIYDQQGRLLRREGGQVFATGLHQHTLPLQGLPSGVYLLRIEQGARILAARQLIKG